MKLHIGTTTRGADFNLPLDLVTQSVAILAKRGVGKTYTAAVFAEQLLEANQIPVIIDPTGAHWGLKSSADGKAPGYPVYVFGGDHGDLPLEEASGETIARALVDHPFPAVLDVSHLRKGQATRFLGAFLEALYRLNRVPLHLICDEADVYAPQRPFAEEARTLGAMEDIVRRGRIKGIGCTLITQRPAVLNKNVLTQCEMLVAMRLVHPKDIDAIKEWVAVHGDTDTARVMIADLPVLPVGTAWIWSPGWGDIFERVKIRTRKTFDSSATPKPGQRVVTPQSFAQVDIEKLGKDIAATVERAKADDPKTLRQEIARLKAEVAKKPAAVAPERVEVPVLTKEDRALIERAIEAAESVPSIRAELQSIVMRHEKVQIIARGSVPAKARPAQAPKINHEAGGALGKCEMAILRVLAQYPDGCEIGKLALLSGYRVSGGFRNSLAALRSRGAIEGENGSVMRITGAGEGFGPFDPLPDGEELRQYWLNHSSFGKCERAILVALLGKNPQTIDQIAKSCEPPYEVSGGFRNALACLRTAGVIVGRNSGEMQPSDELLL